MTVNCCFECGMHKVSETEYIGKINVGYTDEVVVVKYNADKKRGYVKVGGNRWRWIKPQMETPVSVGTISITKAWPSRRVFTIYCDVEEEE